MSSTFTNTKTITPKHIHFQDLHHHLHHNQHPHVHHHLAADTFSPHRAVYSSLPPTQPPLPEQTAGRQAGRQTYSGTPGARSGPTTHSRKGIKTSTYNSLASELPSLPSQLPRSLNRVFFSRLPHCLPLHLSDSTLRGDSLKFFRSRSCFLIPFLLCSHLPRFLPLIIFPYIQSPSIFIDLFFVASRLTINSQTHPSEIIRRPLTSHSQTSPKELVCVCVYVCVETNGTAVKTQWRRVCVCRMLIPYACVCGCRHLLNRFLFAYAAVIHPTCLMIGSSALPIIYFFPIPCKIFGSSTQIRQKNMDVCII